MSSSRMRSLQRRVGDTLKNMPSSRSVAADGETTGHARPDPPSRVLSYTAHRGRRGGVVRAGRASCCTKRTIAFCRQKTSPERAGGCRKHVIMIIISNSNPTAVRACKARPKARQGKA